ncbi:methyl-accepting chemotaxis protein [Magnetospirillum sp. UT-4]|uniref:methyl-accepting chemotaxis protein n=1 Tax=Magnetospirillum sp. UT-4 TaxID=2681467 RepID=UPI001384654B|nr:PAS domain-containing methyl-accepting chemotaxis protein [Magnetospirillum sp. UT-4]CAA7613235.1 PAS [Magnetospirillum sp. UT-4]
MRDNGPITNREIVLEDDTLLVSRTDTGGRISFVNKAFQQISGFAEDELMGAAHNLVRHPHMPKEAFADLWATIKAGKPWEGFVKNRAKNGDHYWVRANVTPYVENGQVAGYISIRSKPSREQVAAAERAYALFREGKAGGLAIREGRAVGTGLGARLGDWFGSVTGAMVMAMTLPLALMAAGGVLAEFGIHGAGWALMGAALLAGVVLAAQAARRLSGPLGRLEASFDTIARGDFAAAIPDEPVGEFRRTTALLRAMKAKLAYAALEKSELDAQAEERRRADLARVAGSLQDRVQGIVELIGLSADSLLGNSQTLSANAQQTMNQAGTVTAMTGQVSGNVEAVSAAAQELSASVQEISRQVSHAAGISSAAVRQAADTDRMVRSLAEAAGRIGEVVNLISQIASQTNLLALNATIEAARAGDAGKGFAVVANEVKSLANQTGKATEEITTQVAAIQAETRSAVDAIQAIAGTIEQINEVSSAIAAAVEEQGAATGEIARAAEQAAAGTGTAAENVASVAGAAEETKLMADQVTSAADHLKGVATDLATQVDGFIKDVRAA